MAAQLKGRPAGKRHLTQPLMFLAVIILLLTFYLLFCYNSKESQNRFSIEHRYMQRYTDVFRQLRMLTGRVEILPFTGSSQSRDRRLRALSLGICTTRAVTCKVILSWRGNLAVTVSLEEGALDSTDQQLAIAQDELSKVTIITHSKTHADFLKVNMGITTELIPPFCENPQRNKTSILKSRYVFSPDGSPVMSKRFLELVDLASDCLDVAVILHDMESIKMDSDTDMPAIVFPTAMVSQDTVQDYYCRNVPILIPTFDVGATWSAVHKDRHMVEDCQAVNVHERLDESEQSHFWSEFPHVVTYNSFYDLVDKLSSAADLYDIALRMHEDNSKQRLSALNVWKIIANRR